MASRLLNKEAPDTKRLFDVLTRQNVYVEGVKLDAANKFRNVARELTEEFDTLLNKVSYRTLDGMTKNELNKFIVTLRRSQSRVYNKYVSELLQQLYKFMVIDKIMTKRIYGSVLAGRTVSESESDDIIAEQKDDSSLVPLFGWAAMVAGADADDKLWSKIANSPMPANGVLMGLYLSSFSKTAQVSIENLVRQGYANKWSTAELRAEIAKRMNVLNNQNSAATDTIWQHVSQSVGGGVASAFASRYRWDSVMDSVTSSICRYRNRKIYRYGTGPLPPAHMRCRSRTTPIFSKDSDDDSPNETFYTWIRRQPSGFVTDVFNAKVASSLIKGESKSTDFTDYRAEKPISNTQYADKLSDILRND